MPFLILLLFIGIPIAEIALLIKVADIIDLWPTIALIVLTAALGVFLLRRQGLSSLARAQKSLNEGRLPVESISDAAGLLLAGAFLLTPGLLTDSLGFALLIPAVRHGLARHLFNRVRNAASVRVDVFDMQADMDPQTRARPFDPFKNSKPETGPDAPIIEGEIVKPKKPANDRSSKTTPAQKRSPWNR